MQIAEMIWTCFNAWELPGRCQVRLLRREVSHFSWQVSLPTSSPRKRRGPPYGTGSFEKPANEWRVGLGGMWLCHHLPMWQFAQRCNYSAKCWCPASAERQCGGVLLPGISQARIFLNEKGLKLGLHLFILPSEDIKKEKRERKRPSLVIIIW